MPRLTHRAVVLEDELTQKAIEIRADQIAYDIEHHRILDALLEERIAMQPEDFADVVFGILRERIGFLLRQHPKTLGTLSPADFSLHISTTRSCIARHTAIGANPRTMKNPFSSQSPFCSIESIWRILSLSSQLGD